MTLYDRMKARERGEDQPLEELCRPLSAKVMPDRCKLSLHGTLTDEQAIAVQRKTKRNGPARAKREAKA